MPVCRPAFCIAGLLTVSSFAWADNIVLDNSTFSTLPTAGLASPAGGGSWDVGAIPGWTEMGSGVFGQFQPTDGIFNYLPTPTIAFAKGTGILFQDAGAVQAGETYILSVDIGERLDMVDSPAIALVVNGVAYMGVGTAPTSGNWFTYTATYNALAPDVGSQIYVELISMRSEADFADVQLADGDPAPEPSTFALLLAGAGALYLGIRRRGLSTPPFD